MDKMQVLKKFSEEFPQNDFYKFANEIPEKLVVRDKIPIWCNKHQIKFYKSLELLIYHHSCQCELCRQESLNYKIRTKNTYLKELSIQFPQNDFFKFINEIPEIIKTKDNLPIWCNKHQIKFYKNVQFITQKHTCNCKLCTKELQGNPDLQKDKFLEKILKEFLQNDFYKFANEIPKQIITDSKIPVWCKKHQVKFYKNMEMIYYRHSCNCDKCSNEKLHNSHSPTKDKYLKELSEQFPQNDFFKFYDEIPDIIKTTDTIPVWCKEHQVKFYKSMNHIKDRPACNCPQCVNRLTTHHNIKHTLAEQIKYWQNQFHDNITYEHVDLSIGTNYNNLTKITLTCPIHGDFITSIGSRRCGSGCTKCYRERQHQGVNLRPECRITTEMWIERFKELYGNMYDYSLIKEIPNQLTEFPIICPKHGVFYRNANKFYYGHRICPKCKTNSKGELLISNWLTEHNIKFKTQKTYPDLIGLGGQPLRYDFYLEEFNILIEFDGIVHFEDHFNRPEVFEKQQKHDQMKNDYALKNNILLLRDSHVKLLIKKIEQALANFKNELN